MLRVMDGARAYDSANNAPDIPQASYGSAPNTANSTSIDMSGHDELLVNVQTGAITGTGTLAVGIQESNEAAANFSNIAGSFLNFANTEGSKSKFASVNWTHPDRKRYARLQGITANNTVVYGATTLRVRNKQSKSTDTNFVLV